MTDWIKVRADGIRHAEKEKKAEKDRQVVAASELKAKTEPFWKDLLVVLERSIKEFNEEFPEAERRIDQYEKPFPNILTFRRTNYPSVAVKISLNPAGTSIQYTINSTIRKGANPVENQANLLIRIVDGDVGFAEGNVRTHEDAARLFL